MGAVDPKALTIENLSFVPGFDIGPVFFIIVIEFRRYGLIHNLQELVDVASSRRTSSGDGSDALIDRTLSSASVLRCCQGQDFQQLLDTPHQRPASVTSWTRF